MGIDHSRPYQLYHVDDRETLDRFGIGIQFLVSPFQGDSPMLSQGIIHVAPGRSTSLHVHRYSGETFYGLEGRGELWIAGEIVPCHAHEHIVFIPPGVPHAPRNPDDSATFRAMFVHVPGIINGDTYTVDEAGNPVEGIK